MKNILKSMLLVGALLLPHGLKAQDMKNVLTQDQQNLITISALEAKGDLDNLYKALDKALDEGLTVSKAKEALSHLYAYTGFPRSLNGLGTLQRVLADRKAAGKTQAEGVDAAPLPADFNALKEGTKVQTQLTGGRGFNYEFAPATDYYLKAHLFGDIFARNNLTFAERELVTIGALSSVKGLDPQLKSHVSGSRNMGVSDDMLRSVPATLAEKVGAVEADQAAKTVAAVLGEQYTGGTPVDGTWPIGDPNTGFAQYFSGNSYLATLAGSSVPLHNVTFEPGCRNNWHVHHGANQVLICVAGRGWYQEWGKPAQQMVPGTVINIPEGVKHWHGATADSWFQHLTYHAVIPGQTPSNEWLEPVADEDYNKLK